MVSFVLAGKKGTKRNACDDPSNVKKQAKVDLYHFVTKKITSFICMTLEGMTFIPK